MATSVGAQSSGYSPERFITQGLFGPHDQRTRAATTAFQVHAYQRKRRTSSIISFHPPHHPRPIFVKRPLAHEQAQVIARGDLVVAILRRRSYQPLHCKQLFRGNHFIGAPGKKINGKPQPREVDLLPEGDEASVSEFVPLVQFLDNFEIIFSGNVDRPGVPGLKDGFEPSEFRREPNPAAASAESFLSSEYRLHLRLVSPELSR